MASEWISTEVRVRYADTDQMGVAYHSNYLVWFEVGRIEYCRQRGLVYRDFEEATQTYLAVAEAQCRYHHPARFDDVLTIRTRIATFRKRIIGFEYEIRKQNSSTLIASGRTLHVILDKNGRPRTFPPDYAKYLIGEEATGGEDCKGVL